VWQTPANRWTRLDPRFPRLSSLDLLAKGQGPGMATRPTAIATTTVLVIDLTRRRCRAGAGSPPAHGEASLSTRANDRPSTEGERIAAYGGLLCSRVARGRGKKGSTVGVLRG
jgi:hypothetical protein